MKVTNDSNCSIVSFEIDAIRVKNGEIIIEYSPQYEMVRKHIDVYERDKDTICMVNRDKVIIRKFYVNFIKYPNNKILHFHINLGIELNDKEDSILQLSKGTDLEHLKPDLLKHLLGYINIDLNKSIELKNIPELLMHNSQFIRIDKSIKGEYAVKVVYNAKTSLVESVNLLFKSYRSLIKLLYWGEKNHTSINLEYI